MLYTPPLMRPSAVRLPAVPTQTVGSTLYVCVAMKFILSFTSCELKAL